MLQKSANLSSLERKSPRTLHLKQILEDSAKRYPNLQGCQIDGMFSNQKSQFGLTLEGLGMEKVGIF
jgi:hypothetical protein